ncbi:MAG: hypothetical protein NVS9B10_08330 [Nevskia sp.]
MIEARDADFHAPPANADFRWAETNFIPFNIPEAGISGAVYCVFRQKLGVVMSDVTIFDRISRHWEGQAYVDNQQHLPCPAKLSDFSLPNGLAIKVVEAPRHLRVDYVGIDDTEVHFDFRGLMVPQDINDPAQDPLTRRKLEQPGQPATAWDGAFGGHFELTGRAQGELILRGKRYAIDSLGTMDHSWGPRAERDNTNAVWFQAHFGDDLVIHALCGLDPRRPEAIGPLWHGYVLRNGTVRGLVSAQGRTDRQGMFVAGQEVHLADEDGRRYRMTGSAVNWGPWAPYPSVVYYQSLTRWNLDGRTGFGPYQEVVSRAFVARHRLVD